ncbi:MAG: ATP-binding protein [Tissierellia bacterium]|nr:ATP-binding protein [Tissierellia bacterium]
MDKGMEIKGVVDSDIQAVSRFVRNTMRRVGEYVHDEDAIFDIRLIIDELVLNGASHGNEWNQDKSVHLTLNITDEWVLIQVRDEGAGLNYSTGQYNPQSMADHGRGLVLVEALSDDIQYHGNCISCKKRLRGR